MNIDNVNKAIAIMLRAKEHNSVDMRTWQIVHQACRTEDELHKYSNKACFAGHIAISPEFYADGGSCSNIHNGCPVYNNKNGICAIKDWLDTKIWITNAFVYGRVYNFKTENLELFYNKSLATVDAGDVLEKLYLLRDSKLDL